MLALGICEGEFRSRDDDHDNVLPFLLRRDNTDLDIMLINSTLESLLKDDHIKLLCTAHIAEWIHSNEFSSNKAKITLPFPSMTFKVRIAV